MARIAQQRKIPLPMNPSLSTGTRVQGPRFDIGREIQHEPQPRIPTLKISLHSIQTLQQGIANEDEIIRIAAPNRIRSHMRPRTKPRIRNLISQKPHQLRMRSDSLIRDTDTMHEPLRHEPRLRRSVLNHASTFGMETIGANHDVGMYIPPRGIPHRNRRVRAIDARDSTVDFDIDT